MTRMVSPVLASLLLGSADPDRLRDWYAAALAPADSGGGFTDVTPTMFAATFGETSLLIDGRSDVAGKNPEPGRVVLNFHVHDARAVAEHLDSLGVTWLVELEEREGGLVGTLVDPDGNYVQIIELSEGHGTS